MAYTDPYNNAMGMINRILDREGGYVNNPADRGGVTNFGISSRANPDIDVANLTREGAADIYNQRYLQPMQESMRGLSPQAQEVAFDAAVNHGPAYAQDLVRQSGGDANTMLQMRQQKYDRIAENDPSQAQFSQGWTNRLDTMRDPQLSSAGDASGISSGLPQMPQMQTAMTRPAQLGGENAAAYEQWMQDQIGAREQTPLQAGLEVFGQSMQHAPYMGNRGFGGGFAAALQAGAAKSGRERAMDKKLEHDLLRFRADMEAQANKSTMPNSYKEWQLTDQKSTYGDWLDRNEEGVEVRPEKLPMGFKDWGAYNAAVNPMRDDFNRDTAELRTVGDQYGKAQRLLKLQPDTDQWSAPAGTALVNILAKTLDPGGRVTDADAKMAAQGGGLAGQAWAWINAYKDGTTKLPGEVIKQMLQTLDVLYGDSVTKASEIEQSYSTRATDMGVTPSHVFDKIKMPARMKFEPPKQEGSGFMAQPGDITGENMVEIDSAIQRISQRLGINPDDVTGQQIADELGQ